MDRFVFAQQGTTNLYKLRFDDGSIAATYPVASYCVPALDKKHRWIYAQENNRLVKLNADDLRLIWQVALDGRASFASPVAVDNAEVGCRVFANTGNGNIYCLMPDGKIAWPRSSLIARG